LKSKSSKKTQEAATGSVNGREGIGERPSGQEKWSPKITFWGQIPIGGKKKEKLWIEFALQIHTKEVTPTPREKDKRQGGE